MNERKRLLLISSVSLSKKNFFPRLTTEIVTMAEKKKYDVLIKMVSAEEDYGKEAELVMLHEILFKRSLDFDVCCIIPSAPKHSYKMIIELMEEIHVPIISIDVRYENESDFIECDQKPPPIVQVDNFLGGRLAAEILSEYFNSIERDSPTILTISGPVDLKHARDRLGGFVCGIKEMLPKSILIPLEPGNWLRFKAEASFESFLDSSKYKEFEAVFAGNDEMALGIRKSIIKNINRGKIKSKGDIKIVGFDNITETQELMDLGDPFMLGTIDQNLTEMAAKLFDLMELMQSNKEYPSEVLIKPTKIASENIQYIDIQEDTIVKRNRYRSLNRIFIIHGHDDELKNELARFLEQLGLEPIILHEQPDKGRTILNKLIDEVCDVNYAFVLLTPDDVGSEVSNPEDTKPRARQNVIFEYGYLTGLLDPSRVCAIRRGSVEIPTDLQGILHKVLDTNISINTIKLDIAKELKAAGFIIDFNKIRF